MKAAPKLQRCPWVPLADPLYVKYHDEEWGVPVHSDKKMFEFVVLEVFQAGLSWRTILHKRKNFRRAFKNFDFRQVANFGSAEIKTLLGNAGIIRNRLKIEAAISNAKRFMEIRLEFGTFSRFLWQKTGGRPRHHKLKTLKDYPATTLEAQILAKELKRRGFKFLGPKVLYAHMQAVGLVNDHTINCFRYRELVKSDTI